MTDHAEWMLRRAGYNALGKLVMNFAEGVHELGIAGQRTQADIANIIIKTVQKEFLDG